LLDISQKARFLSASGICCWPTTRDFAARSTIEIGYSESAQSMSASAHSESASPAEAAASGAVAAPKLKKLKIGGILAAIVITQCLVAYMFLPKGEENSANASTKAEPVVAEASHAKSSDKEKEKEKDKEKDQDEVDLGTFSLTVFNPRGNNNLLIDFHLHGTVASSGTEAPANEKEAAAAAETGDAAKLEKMLKSHKNRFRDQVIITVRNAQLTDLADPALGLLKRQILAKTNALLGEPLLKEVIFSDFVVVEQ
jgi:hypothetical protein